MFRISLKGSRTTLGDIGEADLKILVDQFEEEHSNDRDYFVNADSLQLLVEAGISPDFADMLRIALANAGAGDGDGIDIVWQRV
ncbi:hypothetical protein [Arenimonas composti]|uniref:Galactosyldiacylglycerol synthase n=1 Tax=Arenimonas composti TR7-09 = DSM 18010 TaxID=1121013 RepID=A0A091BEM9_9GAMM|nr:hypothetical protein [Arenimonas composti]KFN50201.1 hypothetical protein P873_07540 [Arenimonas composti TR7-09 = DSM 18010]